MARRNDVFSGRMPRKALLPAPGLPHSSAPAVFYDRRRFFTMLAILFGLALIVWAAFILVALWLRGAV